MSLVLEALRRVEKPQSRPGSGVVVVASSRPRARRRGVILPLVLGLGTGTALLLFPQDPGRTSVEPSDEPQRAVPPWIAPPGAVSGVMPAAAAPEPARSPEVRLSAVSSSGSMGREPAVGSRRERGPAAGEPVANPGPRVRPPLVLQAISERDSLPIAVISDQLVREGDVFEGARILSIGPESVDVLLENGQKATLRFPPPMSLSPSPLSR